MDVIKRARIIGTVCTLIIAIVIMLLCYKVFELGTVSSIVVCVVVVFVVYGLVMFGMGKVLTKTVKNFDKDFITESNQIMREYAGQYEVLYEKLSNMTNPPQSDYAASILHVNKADALRGMGKDEEALEELELISGAYDDILAAADHIREDIRIRQEEEEERREAEIEAAAEAAREAAEAEEE